MMLASRREYCVGLSGGKAQRQKTDGIWASGYQVVHEWSTSSNWLLEIVHDPKRPAF